MSEASASKHIFLPYLKDRLCLELGAGNYRPWPWMFTLDLPGGSYGPTGGDSQQLRGDVRRLPFFCDNALGAISSSHVLEDFEWSELPAIVQEHWRILEPNGYYCINCPTESIYRHICKTEGQSYNLAHKNENFSLETFKEKVVNESGPWEIELEVPQLGKYSWCLVLKALK